MVSVLDVGNKGVGGHKIIMGMVWKAPKAGERLRVFEGVDMVLFWRGCDGKKENNCQSSLTVYVKKMSS